MSVTLSIFKLQSLTVPKGAKGEKGASVTVGSSVLYNYTTDVGTPASTTETDLVSYTNAPGTTNALTANGDEIVVNTICTTAANGNTKNIRVYFGGTLCYLHTTTANAAVIMSQVRIVRVSATSQKIYAISTIDGVVSEVYKTTAAINLQNNQIVKITGENGTAAANDLVCNNFQVSSFKSV